MGRALTPRETLELVNRGVTRPDRYLETATPVAVWSGGGDSGFLSGIGISCSHRCGPGQGPVEKVPTITSSMRHTVRGAWKEAEEGDAGCEG